MDWKKYMDSSPRYIYDLAMAFDVCPTEDFDLCWPGSVFERASPRKFFDEICPTKHQNKPAAMLTPRRSRNGCGTDFLNERLISIEIIGFIRLKG